MRIYDRHIEMWEITVETEKGRLRRARPDDELKYQARVKAANEVLEAIKKYKQLEEK
jgi:hypothetical protein